MRQAATTILTNARNFAISFAGHSLLLLFLLLALVGSASAQTTTSGSDATTPNGLSPGAPAGSYELSGFENVNLYNGNLNFHLPLVHIGGRGTAGYTMTLALNTKKWSVRHTQNGNFESWFPTQNLWDNNDPGYGAGLLKGRQTGFDIKSLPPGCSFSGGIQIYETTLTTLTFIAPDGTEYDLRDQLNGGQRMAVTAGCPASPFTGASRGRVWVTADGSSASFISDDTIYDRVNTNTSRILYPSGYLLLRDGTRYRIDNGQVSWIRDRNGNTVTFDGTTATDSLGRQVTINRTVADDQITYNGTSGAPRTIHITYDTLSNALRSPYTLQTYAQLFPEIPQGSTTTFNPSVVASVVLPDGRSYQFKYNSYGELACVTLPTGGMIEYDMVAGSGVINADGYEIYRRVAERRTYSDSSTLESRTVYTEHIDNQTLNGNYIQEDHYDRDGSTLLASEKHYFISSPRETLLPNLDSSGYPVTTYPEWNEGKEVGVESYGVGTNPPLLRSVSNSWQAGATMGGFSINPQLSSTTSTLFDVSPNLVSKQVFGYDQYSNQTDVYEYDYGQGASPAFATRHNHTDYLTTNAINGTTYHYDTVNPDTTNPDINATFHLRSLVSAQKTYTVNPSTGAETLVAQGTIGYDETSHPLLTYGAVTGWNDPGTPVRGNATTASQWLNTTNSYLQAHVQYDQLGNVRYKWDAGAANQTQADYATQIEYGSQYNYGFPTHTVTPIPDRTGAHGSTTSFETTSIYDLNTGAVLTVTDANGQVTSAEYNDSLDRLTKVVRPAGGGVTSYQYGDTVGNLYLRVESDLDAGRVLDAYQYFDGLGRKTRSFGSFDGTQWTAADIYYDGLGRVKQTSNPYFTSTLGSSVPGSCSACTVTVYDELGRVKTVTTPDNAVVTTIYSGNQVTVTDQAGKKRSSVTDALGRLTSVIEDPAGLNYQTSYSYDTLDNLTQVSQGVQTRTFVYDSLKRLTSATNPESGTVAYQYDNDGNLLIKTDARGVSTHYSYDALNRVTRRWYNSSNSLTATTNNSPALPSTVGTSSEVNYSYDTLTNGKGRLASVSSSVSTYSYSSYDSMGRALGASQLLSNQSGSQVYSMSYSYDLAGHVKSIAYPSGHSVNYNYDAAGRLGDKDSLHLAFTGNLGDGATRTYATGISYDQWGGLAREQFGTDIPLYHKEHRNIRGQLYDIRLSTVNDDLNGNRGAIVNYYSLANYGFGTSGTDNNGNLLIQQHWIPSDDSISSSSFMQENYGYDSLNRINWMGEYQNGATNTGSQTYTYANQ